MFSVHKLLHSLVKYNISEYVMVSSNIRNTRGNYFKLKKKLVNLIICLNHFVVRCVNNWNLLNDNIVCASSFNVFKKRLLLFVKLFLKGML